MSKAQHEEYKRQIIQTENQMDRLSKNAQQIRETLELLQGEVFREQAQTQATTDDWIKAGGSEMLASINKLDCLRSRLLQTVYDASEELDEAHARERRRLEIKRERLYTEKNRLPWD